MRIAVCTSLFGSTPEAQQEYEKKMSGNIETHKEYCRKHGYDYICPRSIDDVYDKEERPFSWYKIKLVQKLVQNYDYVLWTDADTRVNNMDAKIEDLAEYMGKNHVCLINVSNFEMSHLQAGVFLVKKTPKTGAWLEAVWSQRQFLNNIWWEQMAMIHLFASRYSEWSSMLAILPANKPLLQCYPVHNENPISLMIHYPGKLRGYMPKPDQAQIEA